MRAALALVRAAWLSRTSYRLRTILGFGSVLGSVIPLFFIAGALQPIMAQPIQAEAQEFFGFVVVGLIALSFATTAVNTIPGAIGGGIQTGTFEALLSTPASLPAILSGMLLSSLIWTVARAVVLVIACWVLGGGIQLVMLLPAVAILVLLLLAYLPFGLIAAALVLVFRTPGPLPKGVLYLSALLGGVYYPTHVIPSWLQYISHVVPLTYGSRALRKVLLGGSSFESVVSDIAILTGMTLALLFLATLVFSAAFRYARRTGTLAQY